MLAVKLALILITTFTMFFALWKPSVGFIAPPVCWWTYGWLTGFTGFSLSSLVIITAVHFLCQGAAWWLSSVYREANLSYTGAGITGFSTGLLVSIFLGSLLGFFMWWGLIGRLVTQPVTIGVKPIAKSFAGGALKVIYGTIMSGVVAYMLF